MGNNNAKSPSFRWLMLAMGTIILLALGSLYAWSTYRSTLCEEFNWSVSSAQMTFSISMMTFCLGGLFSGIVTKKIGIKIPAVLSAVLMGAGLIMSSHISSLAGLYITYGVLYGAGVGIGYNVVMGTIVKWFPDKTGLCSGILLFGFGISSLIVGRVGAGLIAFIGWRSMFMYFGVVFGIVVLVLGLLIKAPEAADTAGLQTSSKAKSAPFAEMNFSGMLKNRNFWLFFIWVTVLSAAGLVIVGNSAPFANTITGDLASAATIAGIISVCNGFGRIFFGTLFDAKGFRVEMITVVAAFIIATVVLLAASATGSVPVLIISYVLAGFAYGGVTPTNSAFTAKFFGNNNFALNLSIVNLNLLIASYLPQVASKMIDSTGSYNGAFYYVIALAIIAFAAFLFIKAPKDAE